MYVFLSNTYRLKNVLIMKTYFLVLISIAYASFSFACSCAEPPSLCEYSKTLESDERGLIFIGEYIQEDSIGVSQIAYQFKVDRLIRGKIVLPDSPLANGSQYENTDSTVWLLGGDGGLCYRVMYEKALIATTYWEFFGYTPDICSNSYFQIDEDENIFGSIWQRGLYETVALSDVESVISATCTSSIDDLENDINIDFYPNPTSDIVNLKFDITRKNSKSNNISYTITNVTGELIQKDTFKIYGNSVERRIDLSGLQSGVYIMTFTRNRNSYSQKIVKL